MAGKLYINALEGNWSEGMRPRLERAMVEGIRHQAGGGIIGENPHPAGSEANQAWSVGFTEAILRDPNYMQHIPTYRG